MQKVTCQELQWIITALEDRAAECDNLITLHHDKKVELSDTLSTIIKEQGKNYLSLASRLKQAITYHDTGISIA